MNENVKILKTELLSDNWYKLDKVTFEFINKNDEKEIHKREVYDRGNGATVLLYNDKKGKIILTKQFRLPSYLNGNKDGLLIETCAGLLDEDNPVECIKKEAIEETGYKITNVKKIFETYMSPGAVTEILHFFIAEYNEKMKVSEGGGLDAEQEQIEVLEFDFNEAYNMIATGEIKDAKTIMLLQYAKINELL
jgi:GDP-mannose pyrophosphatase NudK